MCFPKNFKENGTFSHAHRNSHRFTGTIPVETIVTVMKEFVE